MKVPFWLDSGDIIWNANEPLDHPRRNPSFASIDTYDRKLQFLASSTSYKDSAPVEHMGPVRQKRTRISRYPFVSVGWAQWQIVRKVWFITRIAPGIFVLGDVTKCDIIARRGTPVHCKLVIAWQDRWHAGTGHPGGGHGGRGGRLFDLPLASQ